MEQLILAVEAVVVDKMVRLVVLQEITVALVAQEL